MTTVDVIPDIVADDVENTTCLNGVLDVTEVCESFDLRGKTCISQGYEGGELKCSDSCMLDFSACFTCGDGNRHFSEICDGSDLDGRTCATELGNANAVGNLACSNDCKTITTLSCSLAQPKVSSGLNHTCSIDALGKVECWGNNSVGQLDAPDEVFIDIATGNGHTCAIGLDSSVQCWG